MMCKLLSQQSAPNVDLDISDGNPLEFDYFMSIFEEMVDREQAYQPERQINASYQLY